LRIYHQSSSILLILAGLFLVTGIAESAPTLRPGQVLKITVAGHSEFTEQVVVNQDGTVDYPLLAGIPIDGLTAEEVRNLLLPSLLKFEREPDVYVVITQVQKIKAQVLGAVVNPGRFEVESPLNLQQLISLAGGYATDADIAHIKIIKSSRQRRQELMVDMSAVYASDSTAIAPYVEDEDIVVIPRFQDRTSIRIFGQVRTPGAIYMYPGDNIYDLILRAGGPSEKADMHRVLLITGKSKDYVLQNVDIEELINTGHIADIPIPGLGDIIIIPEKQYWRDTQWWITALYQSTLLLSSIIVILNII
jgi:polysaccharide export outer membrane protein